MAISWTDIASLATAAGTLVLAVATFGSVRSANRAARAAELSLLAGLRPILMPSREDDPVELLRFGDGVVINVEGHGGTLEIRDDRIYLGLGIRNGGAGVAVIHAWRVEVREKSMGGPPSVEDFRPQARDIFIPAGSGGFWQGAIRDAEDPYHDQLRSLEGGQARVMVDLLYGDHEGGQRTIVRFGFSPNDDEGPRAEVIRYWNLDRPDPRERPALEPQP